MDDQGQPDTRTPQVFRHDGKDYVSMDEYLRLNQRYRDFYSPQWIPVSEWLPKRGQMVIVSFRGHWGGRREVSAETFWIHERGGWTGCDSMKNGRPSHWMPLPLPPEQNQ
jgi:hypothetical protein